MKYGNTIYNSSPNQHQPDEVATRRDVSGVCHSNRCSGRKATGTETSFYGGWVEVRCHACGQLGTLVEGEVFDDPYTYQPGKHDDEPEQKKGNFEWMNRYRGRKKE